MADRRQRFERQVAAIVRVLRESTTDRGAGRPAQAGTAGARRGNRQPRTGPPAPREPTPST
jgi:hypothetical protein